MEATSNINVSVRERMLSAAAGSYLLFNAVRSKQLRLPKALAAGYLLYRSATGHCPLYSALHKPRIANPVKNINIQTTLTVHKPIHEVYAFWHKLENLPLFMKHLKSVEEKDYNRSEWKAFIPGGVGTIHWEAEIVKDEPNHLLGWNSLPGASIENAGKVTFKQAGEQDTELHVLISYRAPLGIAGEAVFSLFNPIFEDMVKEDIRNFKRYIETGEIPTIKNQPSGRTKQKTL